MTKKSQPKARLRAKPRHENKKNTAKPIDKRSFVLPNNRAKLFFISKRVIIVIFSRKLLLISIILLIFARKIKQNDISD